MGPLTVRYSNPTHLFKGPASHPHQTTAVIDPADHHRVERFIDNHPELRLLGTEDKRPNQWIIHVGCASERVCDAFDNWIGDAF